MGAKWAVSLRPAKPVEPRAKIWVERDGKLVLSEYRVRLLKLVSETGSLAEAAKRMGLSYRRAWGKVREVEENLGQPLIESSVGGPHGGGSHLTPLGERLVAAFGDFRERMQADLDETFREFFQAGDGPSTGAGE
jgi:molybdate transport system regulatory protein